LVKKEEIATVRVKTIRTLWLRARHVPKHNSWAILGSPGWKVSGGEKGVKNEKGGNANPKKKKKKKKKKKSAGEVL